MATSPLSAITNDITPGIEAMRQMPTYGRTSDQEQRTIDAADTAAQALEQRYANPNWFNVAAGFFKPQLGGFTASLGSASQALGENLEKQRANEIPAYVARSQVALMKAQRENKVKAQGLIDKWVAKGSPVGEAPSLTQEVSRLGAADLATDIQGVLGNAKTLNESGNNTIQAISGLITTQQGILKDPAATPAQKKAASEALAKLNPQYLTLINAGGAGGAAATPPVGGATAPESVGTPVSAVPNASAGPIAGAGPTGGMPLDLGPGGVNSATGMATEKAGREQAQAYVTQLGEESQAHTQPFAAVANIYPLFGDPGVRLAMGAFDKGDVASMLKTALASQDVSSSVRAMAEKIDPRIERKYPGTIQKMQQILGVAAQQQLAVNRDTPNATRITQDVEKSAVFGPNDAADVAARKAMLALHKMQLTPQKQALASQLYDEGLSAAKIMADPRMKQLQEKWGKTDRLLSQGTLPSNLPPLLRNYTGLAQSSQAPQAGPEQPSGVEAALRANASAQ